MGIAAVAPTDPTDIASARRDRTVDGLLVAVVAVVGLLVLYGTPQSGPYRSADALGAALVLVSAATVWWWRRAPLAALGVAGLVVIVNAALGYRVGVVQYPVYLSLYSVFVRSPRPQRLWGVLLSLAGLAGYAVADRDKFDTAVIIAVAVTLLIAALLGDGVRSRRDLAASQRAALELHGREQAAAMERLVLEERSRLARELHDSVGHAINVMVMQAGVGRHVFAERPQFACEALEHVETVGRVALGELDAVLRVLQPDDREPVAEPGSATLAELGSLCDRIRATGRDVDLHIDDIQLEPSAERAAYRIVQEAITNAARHTAAGRITVSVTGSDDRVLVSVHNAGSRPAEPVPGRGLVNMRERALLEGGHLEYGPVDDGFLVRATLPAGSGR
jgi:signal transduction histidine kinase